MFWLMVVLVVAYIVFAIYVEYRKGKQIIFKEGAWLKLKEITTRNNLPQYIRLTYKMTERSDFARDYHYFEPDGEIKENRMPAWEIRELYEYDLRIAHVLERNFNDVMDKRERDAMSVKIKMQKKSLKAFLEK